MWCHCILPSVSLVRVRNWGSYQIACMAYPRPNGWCPYVRNCPVPEVSWTGDFLLLFGSLSVLLYGSPADPTCYTHGIGKKKNLLQDARFPAQLVTNLSWQDDRSRSALPFLAVFFFLSFGPPAVYWLIIIIISARCHMRHGPPFFC